MYEIPEVCAIEPVDALRCQKYENLKLLFFPGEHKTFAAYEQSNSELFFKLQITVSGIFNTPSSKKLLQNQMHVNLIIIFDLIWFNDTLYGKNW